MQRELTEVVRVFESRLRARQLHHSLHDELMADLLAAMAPYATVERAKPRPASGWEVGKQEDMGRFGLGIVGDGCRRI